MTKQVSLIIATLFLTTLIYGQKNAPAEFDTRIYDIIDEVSADQIQKSISKLASFGTRHTLSDTVSDVRGIGAARRWIKSEFEHISSNCNNCLEVFYQSNLVKEGANNRIPFDVEVVNVVAIQKGKSRTNDYIIMSGDIDSRISDPNNYTDDSPGANDNASGMAGTIEAARVLSRYDFEANIVYIGLSGEEQGLFGGKGFAEYADSLGWNIVGVLNNDMIGNIKGVDGVIDNRSFRIFSEPVTKAEVLRERERIYMRVTGGEVDGISRQLARYVHKQTTKYMPEMNPMLIYRLDRFGRGGHHRPFNDRGFAGIRIMEAHEDYTRQHQDVKVENDIDYGDVLSAVNFEYAKKLTAVNAISLACLAWSPKPPAMLGIGGVVQPSTILKWDKPADDNVIGYKVYWRDTTAPQWQHTKYVGDVDEITLDGIVIDNFFFGVSSVNANGNESVIVYPSHVLRK